MTKSKVEPIENLDPLRKIFTEYLHLTPLTLGIFIFILDLIVDSTLGIIYGYAYPGKSLFITSPSTPPRPGLLQDYMALITDFIYAPVIAGVYLWSTEGSTRVFQQLLDSEVFRSERKLQKNTYKISPLI